MWGPRVTSATSTAISRATSALPMKWRIRFKTLVGAANASAQLPRQINATGSRIAAAARMGPAGAGVSPFDSGAASHFADDGETGRILSEKSPSGAKALDFWSVLRSEEHTSVLQSLR